MNEMDMMSPTKVAETYGGDKRKIGQAVQMGLIDPTVGVMAGMFIDRMRAAAAKEQQPTTTVAQEVMAPAVAPAAMPAAGLAAAQAAPVERGLDALPVPEEVVPSEYAGGGIVAFAGPQGSLVEDIVEKETREIERGLRPDYSAEAKQIMMQGSGSRDDYLSREQQRLLGRSREIGRTSGAFVPVSASAAPTPAPTVSPAVADRSYADESTRGTASYGKDSGLAAQVRDLQLAAAKRDAEAAAAAAPQTRERVEQEFIPTARRAEIVPASFETALEKARSAMGALPKEDPYAEIKAELAERKGKADENLKNAAYLRLAEAGFGMLAGTSPYAAVNIGKSAVQSIKNYGEDLKDQKKLDREDRKLLADIKKLEQSDARNDVFKTTELAYRILNEANEDVRTRIVSDTQLQAASMQAGATRERTAFERENLVFQRAMTLANTAEQNVRTSLARQAENPLSPVAKFIKANPNYIEEQAIAARNRILKDSGLSVPSMTGSQTGGGTDYSQWGQLNVGR